MSDYKTILERAQHEFPPPELPLEGVFRRRDRWRRNQRIAAAAVGLAIALGVILIGASITRSTSAPAGSSPSTPPLDQLRTSVLGLHGTIQRKILGLPDDAFGVRLSPDGTKVVFVTRDTVIQGCGFCADRPAIAIMNIDGTGAQRVIDRWPLVDMPAWSPDGSQIAFMAEGSGSNKDIYLVNTDGSRLRRLTTDPKVDSYPSWSPDGSTIVYDNAGDVPPDAGNLSRTMELWTVPAAGGTPTRLTHDNISEKQPVYSPDGSTIAVSRGDAGIWLLNADGSHPRRVEGIPVGSAVFTPRWSPDGSRLAFLTFVLGRRPLIADPRFPTLDSLPPLKLSIVDLSTHRVIPLGVSTASDVNGASWFPDGSELLFELVSHV
jgi:Tol biopolymer transport system component